MSATQPDGTFVVSFTAEAAGRAGVLLMLPDKNHLSVVQVMKPGEDADTAARAGSMVEASHGKAKAKSGGFRFGRRRRR